jgi:hypothetical protein
MKQKSKANREAQTVKPNNTQSVLVNAIEREYPTIRSNIIITMLNEKYSITIIIKKNTRMKDSIV